MKIIKVTKDSRCVFRYDASHGDLDKIAGTLERSGYVVRPGPGFVYGDHPKLGAVKFSSVPDTHPEKKHGV